MVMGTDVGDKKNTQRKYPKISTPSTCHQDDSALLQLLCNVERSSPPPPPLITQEMQASFQIQTWSCHHCAVSVLGSCSTQGRLPKSKGKLIRVNIKQGERSAAARGFCTPLNQVLTCKAFTGPFPSRTPAL